MELFLLLKSHWQGLTPELSRAAARLGGVVHVTAQAEPRSGLGLNELLGASSPAAHYVDESMLQGHWHQAEAKDAERDATEEDEPEVKAHGQE